MAYNSVIDRTAAAPLIPEEVIREIQAGVTTSSAVLSLARKLPNMARAQSRIPVMSALATAYFVTGDTGLKQTSKVEWANKYIDAEELAVIVPVPQAVLNDADYDIWNEVKPSITESIGKAVDAAVLYGTNIPASWTTDLGAAGLVAGALAASHNVALSGYTDMYEAVLGETDAGTSGLFGMIEDEGYMVTGSIADLSMKRKLRNVRSEDGIPIFQTSMQQPGQFILDGAPIIFPTNGSVSSTYLLISGMWNKLVYAIREDMTFAIATEASIHDASGTLVYNLFQQDMVALRCIFRLGVALPHPVTRLDAGTGFPFAYMTAT
jgi:HK97 family phage major capsid protein